MHPSATTIGILEFIPRYEGGNVIQERSLTSLTNFHAWLITIHRKE